MMDFLQKSIHGFKEKDIIWRCESGPVNHRNFLYQKHDRTVLISTACREDLDTTLSVLSQEFSDLCDEINSDKEVRVIVLTSDEKGFFPLISYTTDLHRFSDNQLPHTDFPSIADAVAGIRMPVIAAINGNAIGFGLEIALACDIRIASAASHFGLDQIKTGLMPCDGGTQRLPAIVGKGRALELILTGKIIDAKEAHFIGLVSEIIKPEQLVQTAIELAREIGAAAPVALMYLKEAVQKGMDMTLEQGLRMESDLYFLLQTTEDRAEGIHAFRERRTPAFKGK